MKQKYTLRAARLAIAPIVLILAGGFVFRGTHDRNPAAQTPTTAPTVTDLALTASNPTPPPAASISAATTNKIFLTAALLWQRPIAEEAFAQFHDWAERYVAAAVPEKSALEVEGITLARARREALAAMIKTDPERALELSVPVGVRRALPPAVQSLLEERVSSRGTLAVLGVLPEPGKEDQVAPTIRTAQFGTRELNAFVYGRRLGEPTRANIPLNGIAVDNYFAVNENAVRVLEPAEAAEAKAQNTEAICSVSGQAANIIQQEVAAEVGGQTVFLCRPDHVVDLNERVVAAESGPPGPEGGGPEASTWTEGLKKLILIRVDFPDLTLSLTESGGATLVTNLHNFYNEMSYGRTGFQPVGAGSDVTPTFRMTNAAAWYGTNDYYNQLRTEARAAATAAGYVLGNYDRDVICLGAVPGFGWSGLAYVGGAGAWLRNAFTTGVAGHELGHNWGLNHANFWDTSSQSVIGPGTSVEYGDSFDTMGSASAGNNHFNARYKNYLNWLTTNEVVTATTNGTYRVYAHDDPNSSGIRGLKIVKNSQTNYWVEFRQKFTSVKWLMNGAGLRWAQSGNQKSQLLDTTPGSTDLKNDAAIVIGRTFSDKESGIHITPIGKGGTAPESLDVVVNLGSFPGDLPPTLALTASATNAAPGIAIDFTANASDPDGDSLAYWWDFGDGSFATTNRASASKSWSAIGEYLVRCVASDMKGGVADNYVVVTIGSPTTFRISGRITDGNAPLEGVRVYVSTARMSYTDSDGNYTIVGLPAGSYNVNAMLDNYSFTAPGFSNPVSVGPNKSAIDFLASYAGSSPPTITTQPFSQSVSPGANATFTVAATGTPPPACQWRFNGASIPGATAASYTKSNVQATDAGNYSVVVSNVLGTATSANAVLTVNSALTISSSPQNQTVIAGSNATFTVTAGGTAPFYYQWQFIGTPVAGATDSVFTITNAQPVNAGAYSVVVTNVAGAITSAVATLTVNVPPGITAQPQDQSVLAGQPANLSVTATGTAPLSYQWQLEGAAISGATASALNLANAQLANAGAYTVVVTNVAGSITSAVANLTVNFTLTATAGYGGTVTKSPDQPSYTANSAVTLTASASGFPFAGWSGDASGTNNPLTVILTTNQIISANFTSPVPDLIIDNPAAVFTGTWTSDTSAADEYGADYKYTGTSPNSISATATFTPTIAVAGSYDVYVWFPTITKGAPNAQFVLADTDGGFTNTVSESSGSGGWLLLAAGRNFASGTNGYVRFTNLGPGGKNAVADAVRWVYADTQNVTPPGITGQPQNQTVSAGQSANFTVAVTGTAPLSYQWRQNGAAISDATASALSIVNAQPANAGDYTVVVTNLAGASTSAVAMLTINVPPGITTQPQDQTVIAGQPANLGVTANGTSPMSYQWLLNGVPMPGATTSDLNIASVQPADAGEYTVVVVNVAGSVTSAVAVLTVNVPPGIMAQPQDQTVIAGQPASLSVTASGTAPLSYQWHLDGLAISGATDPTLNLVNAQPINAGAYSVVVTNLAGSVTSAAAILAVIVPPEITVPPQSLRVVEGHDATFSVTPTGTGPLVCQWRFGEAAISGATNATLNVSNTTPASAGNYSVTITNLAGAVTSAPAALVISVRPVMSSLQLPAHGQVEWQLTGTPGDTYAIESSSNLGTWTPAATLTNTTGTLQFTDPTAVNQPQRFYRVRLVP